MAGLLKSASTDHTHDLLRPLDVSFGVDLNGDTMLVTEHNAGGLDPDWARIRVAQVWRS